MRPSLKIALYFAIGWVIVKLLLWRLGISLDSIVLPGLINNLFLLIAISLGIYKEKRKQQKVKPDPLADIKNGMRTGVLYILVVVGFMYFYYDSIQPQFINNRIEQRMDNFEVAMERPAFIDSLRNKNTHLEASTKEEIIAAERSTLASNLSPFTMFIFSLLGLIILALSYSIFISLIYQKILFRDYYN